MKKLLTLAAVVLAAVCVQAATTEWGWLVNDMIYVDGASDGIPTGTIQLVYDGTTMDSQSLDAAGNASGTITGNTTDAAFTGGAAWDAVVTLDIAGKTYKQTFAFTMPSGLTGDAMNDSQIYNDLNQALTQTIMPNYYLDTSTMESEGWVAIPEPTSVALLALGLAALGLKRKIA